MFSRNKYKTVDFILSKRSIWSFYIFLIIYSLKRESPTWHTHILDSGVTSHNVIDQSMIINFEMKKIFGGVQSQAKSSGFENFNFIFLIKINLSDIN
jgi:hypothetical protein